MRSAITSALLVACCACTSILDFDKPLILPDWRDGSSDVVFACETDEDCSALGPCIVCEGYVCIEAPGADQDLDGFLDATCRGIEKGNDCDDLDPNIHPEADERCNGSDDDCDGMADEGEAFGIGWMASIMDARDPVTAPVPGRTGLVWESGTAPCPSVYSASAGEDGIVRYPVVLSTCGEDPWITPLGASEGYAAVWVDRTSGGAEVFFRLLDPLGQPVPYQPEPVNVSDDFAESDMPALTWDPSGLRFGVAWLTHDTDDRTLLTVYFDVLDPSGTPLLSMPVELSPGPFTLTAGIDTAFGERIEILSVNSPTFEGFAVTWVTDGGIWIANIALGADGASVAEMTELDLSTVMDTAGAILPSLAWADDRFVIAYSMVDPSGGKPSPDVMLAEVTRVPGPGLVAMPIDLVLAFTREATYPAIGWHDGLGELGLAWADGREGYGLREVRFTRLKLVDGPGSLVAQPVIDELSLTSPGVYAGGVTLGIEQGSGFSVAWTERSDDMVGARLGWLECRR